MAVSARVSVDMLARSRIVGKAQVSVYVHAQVDVYVQASVSL